MRSALGVGWASLLALMWLLGGAFLPSQLLWISVAAILLSGATLATFHGSLAPAERWLLAGLGLAGLGLLVVHGDPVAGLERLGWWAVAWFALIAARRVNVSPWERMLLLGAALCVAVGTLAEGVVLGVPRAGGLFENPNVAAGVLVPALAFTVGLKGLGPLRWMAALVLLGGLAATGSRAGLLGAVAVGVVLAPRRVRRWWPVAVLLLAGLGIWRFTVRPDPLAWRRPAIWKAAALVAVHHPLWGASAGAFDEAVLPYRPEEPTAVARWSKRPGVAESTPLQAAAELGFPAAAALVCGVLLLAAGAVRRGPAAASMVLAVLVPSAFHDVLGVPVLLWSWAWMVGRVAGPPGPYPGDWRPRPAMAAAGVAAAVLLGRAMVSPELALVRLSRDGPAAAVAAEPLLPLPWLERLRAKLAGPRWSWSDAAEALDAAERNAALHPADPNAWRLLGECSARIVRELAMLPPMVQRAEEAFARAATLDPHNPWTWLGWARLERDRGRLERALALARRAVEEEPHLVQGWLLLGRVALDRGEIRAARTALQRVHAALGLGRGRLLNRYERDLLAAPPWQLEQLEKSVP